LILRLLLAGLLVLATGAATAESAVDDRIVFPERVSQGALVYGKVPPGSRVQHAGRELRATGYGTVVFGIPRDASGTLAVEVERPDGRRETVRLAVAPRDFGLEVIDGVPPRTVDPPPQVAARIAREAAAVAQARTRDDPRTGFAEDFDWPVRGRISGRFGSGRVYNGRPGGGHSGMDIAAPAGTPIRAPASGVVTLADDLYITGGTVLLDHGHGVSSNFLHLSRIDVKPGDQVARGHVIGAVGATGRATGPHLHWGMNWFDVRVDPLLVLERAGKAP
jgi:biotin carboxyl carrier protein